MKFKSKERCDKGYTNATEKSGNGNENRSQQNGEYLQLRLAVGICFLRSCVLKSVSIQNIHTKQKAPMVFSGSYLSRTDLGPVRDKYDPKKSG